MDLTEEVWAGLDVALNEAALVGVRIDPASWTGYVTLAVLTLPEDGPPPADSRVLFVLDAVGRVAVSLRRGLWNDDAAPVEELAIEQLESVVQSFGQQPVYGWRFFDVPESEDFARWSDRLSLDVFTGTGALAHSLILFQTDGDRRILEFQLWFDTLEVRDATGTTIPLDRFAADGRRWWDALYRGDARTSGAGIIPLGE